MKILQSSIFRALAALAVGTLLIIYPDNTLTWLTIAIGTLFLLSGVVSVVTWLYARRHVGEYKVYDASGRLVAGRQPALPIVGIGSIILGLILALMPQTFVQFQMYFVGAVLVLGALNQYMNLVAARYLGPISLWFWLLPTLVLVAGLVVLLKPMESAELPLIILGWCAVVYGIAEIANSLKFYSCKRQLARQEAQLADDEDDPIIEEIVDDDAAAGNAADDDSDSAGTAYTPVTIPSI